MSKDFALVQNAIAFAARAHRHQVRKDGQTPYVSHCVRVMMTVSQVFGIHDPKVLAAAMLHDTLEDTTTDFDDLANLFGQEVAGWVAALTKDMRLPEADRERAYVTALIASPWTVMVCKLADIFDNLCDTATLAPATRARTIERSHQYLIALKAAITAESYTAYAIVERKLADERKGSG
jgi:guanosine-3',5'-bis(diphosphate) 3'-pyrophosphohydrolase